jgi:hypothetical protein
MLGLAATAGVKPGRFGEATRWLQVPLPDDDKWHGEHVYAWSLLQERGNWWEPTVATKR